MRGPEATFALLAETDNGAAVPVLLRGLDSTDRSLRERAIKALLHRRSKPAEEEILRRWQTLPDHWREMIAERVGWLSSAIRRAILGFDVQFNANGCAALIDTRDFDLIPVLVTAATDAANPFAQLTAETTLKAAELLHDELVGTRNYSERRNPQSIRQFVLPSLEKAVASFAVHGRPELLEAYLLLAGRENAGLKQILGSINEPSHGPLMEILAKGSRTGIIRLLLNYLEDPHAPSPVINLLGRRSDVSFLRQLFRRIGAEPSKSIALNLKRIDYCSWLQTETLLDGLHENEQPGLVNFAGLSHIDRRLALRTIERVLKRGAAAARKIAVQRLETFPPPEGNDLILAASNDNDPHVRASAAVQLRKRSIAGAIPRLVEMIESPYEVERVAAREALSEFEFSRLLDAFDDLPPEVQRMTGKLVRKVDEHALTRLAGELNSDSRAARKRALEVAAAMDAVGELHREIRHLLHDEDQYLRADAVRVLATLDTPESRAALREALTDASPLVQETADRCLAEMSRHSSPLMTFALPDLPPPGVKT